MTARPPVAVIVATELRVGDRIVGDDMHPERYGRAGERVDEVSVESNGWVVVTLDAEEAWDCYRAGDNVHVTCPRPAEPAELLPADSEQRVVGHA